MTTLFVNDLTVIDFSYIHEQRGLLGESWILDVALTGELNPIGFIFDFGKVKKTIKRIVDDHIDHKCLIPKDSTTISIDNQDEYTHLEYRYPNGNRLKLGSPDSALTFLAGEQITKEAVIDYLKDILKETLPKNITDIALILRDEQINGSFYHYSHGLKKHDGNCQRIAHGHRSRIVIQNGIERLSELEARWAKELEDGYIGCRDDVKTTTTINQNPHIEFEYESEQGRFSLTIPESVCTIIEEETSVENIAKFIAEKSQSLTDLRPLEIRAFEGVGKGAISKI